MSTMPNGGTRVEANAETVRERRVDLQATRKEIRSKTLSLAKKMKELAEIVGSVQDAGLKPSQFKAFMTDCGLADREVKAYLAFAALSEEDRDTFVATRVHWDTLQAFAAADGDTRGKIISSVRASVLPGAKEIRQMSRASRLAKRTPAADSQHRRAEKFAEVAQKVASESINAITRDALALLECMSGYDKWVARLQNYFAPVNEPDTFEKLSSTYVEALYEKWPSFESRVEAYLAKERSAIIERASALLADFDVRFPGVHVEVKAWQHVAVEDPTRVDFAKVRHALFLLSQGNFNSEFPRIESEYHQWDAQDSIAYLAGKRYKRDLSWVKAARASGISVATGRNIPALRKLNAVSIGSGVGGEILGLEAAGFVVERTFCDNRQQARSIQGNRRDLKVIPFSIKHAVEHVASATIKRFSSSKGPLHLLAGTLPHRPLNRRGRGEDDPRESFTAAFAAVEYARPQGFFFETSTELNNPARTYFRDSLKERFARLGYHTEFIPSMNAADFGVPQNRPRSLLIGIVVERAAHLQLPFLSRPIRRTLPEVIKEQAFRYRREALHARYAPPREPRMQAAYDKWASSWLDDQRNALAPDTLTLHATDGRHYSDWEKVAINFALEEEIVPHPDLSAKSFVPLTLSVLRRIQGLPPSWQTVGDVDQQRRNIAETMPPVVARVIGQALHNSITGGNVDLDLVAAEPMERHRHHRWGTLRAALDPSNYTADEWHDFIVDVPFRRGAVLS